MKTVCTSTFGLSACPLYGCCVKICTCLIERLLGRMILFYMERFYEGVRFSRLRGGSCPAPGKRSFGSEEEAARLRGGGCSAPGRKCVSIDVDYQCIMNRAFRFWDITGIVILCYIYPELIVMVVMFSQYAVR